MKFEKRIALAIAAIVLSFCGGRAEMPVTIVPGIVRSAVPVDRQLLVERHELNIARDVWQRDDGSFLIAGDKAICEVGLAGAVVRCDSFPLADVGDVFIRRGSDSDVAILSAIWGSPAAATLGRDGSIRWRYDMDQSSVGVVSIAGSDYVVVGGMRHGLTYLKASDGSVAATLQAPDSAGLATGDFDGDGNDEVVSLPWKGPMARMTELGRVAAQRELGFGHTVPVASRDDGMPDSLFISSDSSVYELAADLTVERRWVLPDAYRFNIVAAARSRTYYAFLLAGPATLHRTLLCIYAGSGPLLFEEMLPDDSRMVRADVSAKAAEVSFLVGGRGTLWRYRLSAGEKKDAAK